MTPEFTPHVHRTGGALLMSAGLLDVIAGLASAVAAVTPPSLTAAVAPALFGPLPLVVFFLGSGVAIVVGCIEIAGGWAAATGRYWYGSLATGVLGQVVVITLPLNVLAVVLVALAEGQFVPPDTGPVSRRPGYEADGLDSGTDGA